MIEREDWTLAGAEGEAIFGTTHRPASPRGVLLLAHGFKGYKDYGLFPHLAEAAAHAGLIAHRFNFSHSGMTTNVETFERPDLFERDTWGRQIFDLHTVARAARGHRIAGGDLPQVWFGHSRGGVAAILAAAEVFADTDTDADADADTGSDVPRPEALIAAATPHSGNRLDDAQKRLLRREGRLESPSSRTGQVLHVGVDWLDEFEADPHRYDPMQRIAHIRCPILLLHGDEDATVDAKSSKLLHNASTEWSKLMILRGATHTFNAPNPLPLDQTPPEPTQQMIRAVCDFALRELGVDEETED